MSLLLSAFRSLRVKGIKKMSFQAKMADDKTFWSFGFGTNMNVDFVEKRKQVKVEGVDEC